MKQIKNKKYLQQKFSRKVLVLPTTADFTSRVGKSYVPFTCKFLMVMYFVPILHKRCRSKTNFYVFSYDKTSLKFCALFRFFLVVFTEKFQKIRYLSYVRRGIVTVLVVCYSKEVYRNSCVHFFVLSTSNVCRLWKDEHIKLKFSGYFRHDYLQFLLKAIKFRKVQL